MSHPKRNVLRVARDSKPPEKFIFNGVPLEFVKTAYNSQEKITHYIYRSRKSGWLMSFSDRQFAAGIDLAATAAARGILSGITSDWRD